MQITRKITIEAPSQKVWKVLAHQFHQIDRWASSVSHSAARIEGEGPSGAPFTGRVCETDLGPFRETLTEYDDARQTLAYEASGEKMPFFVKGLRNRWSLSAFGSSRTHVDMHMTVELAFPFNLFMTPVMKRQMGGVLTLATQELKHYVETGSPHPRKSASTPIQKAA